jgi:hypothetical protein
MAASWSVDLRSIKIGRMGDHCFADLPVKQRIERFRAVLDPLLRIALKFGQG